MQNTSTIKIAIVFHHNEDQQPKFNCYGDYLGAFGNTRDLAQFLKGVITPSIIKPYTDRLGEPPLLNLDDDASVMKFIYYANEIPCISIKFEDVRI